MIVADTNTIAYLFLPTTESHAAEKVLSKDDHWVAPWLWRSEHRNILALYLRKGLLDFATASQIQQQAETLLAGREYDIDSPSVLQLAHESGCSAYDCEFVALAKSLAVPLVTSDKKVLATFGDIAISPGTFVS